MIPRTVFASAFVCLLTASVSVAAQTQNSSTPATSSSSSAGAAVQAREVEPLVTDRPDFTESTEVIQRRVLQIEGGVTFEGSGAERAFTAPQTLFRLGVGHRTELRLGGDGLLREWSNGRSAVTGHSDLEIGFKTKLLSEDEHGFDLAVIPILSLPFNDTHFSTGAYDPTVKIAFARSLPSEWSLGSNLNFASVTDADGRLFQSAVSATVAHDLARDFGGYAEVFGFLPAGRGTGAAWTFNGGISRPVGPRMQWDVEVGKTTGGATGWFMGAGFALRTPR